VLAIHFVEGNSFTYRRFIAELLNGPDLVKCAKAGNYSAAQTIQHEGSTIPKYNPEKNW
jgi:adenosine kinase